MSILYKTIISLLLISSIATVKIIVGSSGTYLGGDFTPATTKVSSQHLSNVLSENDDFEYVDKNVERFLRRNNLAGATLAISKDGELKFAKGYGWADKEHDIKVQPYNLFRIASVSKLVTAVAVMKLVESNQLKLDDTVFGKNGILNSADYLNYKDKRVENITVRMLLNHTSGWSNRWGDPMFIQHSIAQKEGFDYPISREDIIMFMLQKRLHYPPGTMNSYSNFGYAILQKVIETVTKTPYESYVKAQVLYPLEIFDMKIGGSYLSERMDLEVKYYEPDEPFLVTDHLDPHKLTLRSYGGNDIQTLGAAGGWVASACDLLKLVVAIDGLDVGKKDILSQESIHEMVTIHPGESPLGWRGVRQSYWYRTGTLAGTSALIMRYDNGISYAIIFNSSSWKGPEFASDIRQMMTRSLASIKEWPEYNLFELNSNPKSERPSTIF